MVSGGTVSLGIAGCLRYNEVNEFPLQYIVLASAAGLLLLLLIITVLLCKHGCRSKSTQRSAETTSIQAGHSTQSDTSSYYNDGYLAPNPAVDSR